MTLVWLLLRLLRRVHEIIAHRQLVLTHVWLFVMGRRGLRDISAGAVAQPLRVERLDIWLAPVSPERVLGLDVSVEPWYCSAQVRIAVGDYG